MDAAKEARLQRLTIKFAGDQRGLMCRKVLASWREVAAAEGSRNALLRQLDTRKQAQMGKLMTKFASDQRGLMCRKVLASWREVAVAEQAQRALDTQREAQRKLLRRHFAFKFVTVGCWVADVVLAAFFAIWQQDVTQEHVRTPSDSTADRSSKTR